MRRLLFTTLLILLGTAVSVIAQPDPDCACSDPDLVIDLSGKSLVYAEISCQVTGNGSFLVRDNVSGSYYLSGKGVTSGPFQENDPAVKPFLSDDLSDTYDPWVAEYGKYISKNDDRYTISFAGKAYGDFYEIIDFHVTGTSEKFLAVVSDREPLGLKLEKINRDMDGITTDEQKKELELRHARAIEEEMMAGDDPMSNLKMITNIPDAVFDPEQSFMFLTDVKYDEILKAMYDDNGQISFFNLSGKRIMTIGSEYSLYAEKQFLSSDNSRYAVYGNGTLTFSDGTTKSDLFNPYLMKSDGIVYLAYLYYSPSRNSICQCKIQF